MAHSSSRPKTIKQSMNSAMDMSIKPFKANILAEKIDAVKKKLSLAEFPEESQLTDSWDYGAPVSHVKRLAKYWQDGFDWRAQEANLNTMPQFTTKIDMDEFGELEIHFVHKKSGKPGAIPLLFCHGWPGNFAEC